MLGEPPIRYVIGDFELEPGTHRLLRRGEPVRLQNKPFKILNYLIEHRDRLVSRSELLEHFWDGHLVYEETLTKSIGAIRKALDDSAESPRFVETHWAEGYRFIHPVEEFEDVVCVERVRTIGILVEESSQAETHSNAPVKNVRSKLRFRWAIVAFIPALAFVIAAGIFVWNSRSGGVSPGRIRSTAVLPLKNLTGDRDRDYLCEGISDALITSLSQSQGLRVIAHGSTAAFRDREIDPIAVGRDLDVESVLVGSLKKRNEGLYVSVQLIDTRNSSVAWATESKDHALSEIYSLQAEIVETVNRVVVANRSNDAPHIARVPRPEAYDAYLRGRSLWNRRAASEINQAIALFESAVGIDPGFAAAYAGLADCYSMLSYYTDAPARDTFPKAKAFAQRALEIDPGLAEAHASLGLIIVWYELDWAGSERSYRRAIELNPSYATARHWYGNLLLLKGRYDESIVELSLARELDPLSSVIATDLGMAYFFADRFDEAIPRLQAVIAADPKFTMAHYFLGWSKQGKGDIAGAITSFETAARLAPERAEITAMLSQAYAFAGDYRKARSLMEIIKAREATQPTTPFARAIAHIGLNEKEAAIAALEQCYREQDTGLAQIKINPLFDGIRTDPRFQKLLEKVGLAN